MLIQIQQPVLGQYWIGWVGQYSIGANTYEPLRDLENIYAPQPADSLHAERQCFSRNQVRDRFLRLAENLRHIRDVQHQLATKLALKV